MMRLIEYKQGAFVAVTIPNVDSELTDDEANKQVEDALSRFVGSKNQIDTLAVDFFGQYVPVVHKRELRLIAALLRAYYASAPSMQEHEVSCNIRLHRQRHRCRPTLMPDCGS